MLKFIDLGGLLMIISFDLDDTLFVSEDKFDVEKPLQYIKEDSDWEVSN